LGGCSNEVVCSGDIRKRIMLQDLRADPIELRCGNRIVGELRSGRRVENRLGKNALSLRQRGNYAEACDACPKPRALPVCEEESLIGLNRAAERQAILIAAELRLRTRLREQVPRVQSLVPEELERASVEIVAAGFSDHHYGSPV